MPTPKPNESQESFIKRCIPQVLSEGLRGKRPSRDQAIAACTSMYKQKKQSNFTIWKERDGYKWFAIWSNKYRDRDLPPEIITNDAHLDFVKAVADGEWPYPELRIWHIGGSAFGDATYIDYDDVNGFSLAGGTIRKGMDAVVEALNSTPVEIRVSHGFPITETRREDPSDPTIITRFRSEEISPLPAFAAANEGTDFVILGGTMSEVKPTLKERLAIFLGSEKADGVADDLNLRGNEAKDAGLEFKDADETAETDQAETDQIETDQVESENSESDDEAKEAPITREEIAGAMEFVSKAVLKEIVLSVVEPLRTEIKALKEQIADQSKQIETLRADDEEKIAKEAAWTSAPSLTEIMRARSIGKKEAQTSGRESLARSGPKEAKEENLIVNTGVPALNSALSGIVSGEFVQEIRNG